MASPAAQPVTALPVAPRDRLEGRDQDLAFARVLLLEEAVPLLTLTGPGGVGKTRFALALAHAVAEHFADGAAWVDLAPLADPQLLPAAVARALGVAEAGEDPLPERLVTALRTRQILLVLDNCEHLLDAAALVATLLAGCPALQVLATSRAPLRLRGEHLLPVAPLALPTGEDPAAVAASPAAALFARRARAADPRFVLTDANAAAVAGIVRRLDGLPLAIELAAAWARALPPSALLARLPEQVLDLGGGERDAPPRQWRLRDTVAWGHDLLGEEARALFRRLGVFAGGFDLAAVAVVATAAPGGPPDDPLPALADVVDHSLVRPEVADPTGSARFAMLETIRAFALEQLAGSGEGAAIRAAHAAHFLAVAEAAEPRLRGRDQRRWLAVLEDEHPNLRQALAWYRDQGDRERALRLAGALGRFWEAHGHVTEGRRQLDGLLADAAGASDPVYAKALSWAGTLSGIQDDFAAAEQRHREALRVFEAAGDSRGVAWSLNGLAGLAIMRGDLDAAEPPLREALDRYGALGDTWGTAYTTANLGWLAQLRGDPEAAERAFRVSLEGYRAAGDPAAARALLGDAIALQSAHGDPLRLAYARYQLAFALQADGDHAAAAATFRGVLEICQALGTPLGYAQVFEGMAPSLLRLGLTERAARLLGAAAMVRQEVAAAAPPADAAAVERTLAEARDTLGVAAFRAAWDAGRALPLERALAEALAADRATGGPAPGFGLTRREREILALLCHRLTNLEIADRLFLSPRTVGTHVANLMAKLGAANRREAAALAVRHGLA